MQKELIPLKPEDVKLIVVYHKNKQIKSSYLSTADNQVDTSGTLRNYF